MWSRGRMPGLGGANLVAGTIVDPNAISSSLAKLVSRISAAGGADAYNAQQAANAARMQAASTAAAQASYATPGPNTFNPAVSVAGPDYMKLAMYAGGGIAGVWLLMKLFKSSPSTAPSTTAALPVHKNPSRVPVVTRTQRLKNAVKSYESFHWGDKPSKLIAKKVSKAPKVGVKLGKLVSVAYETHKNGEHAVWEHEFGEEGGKRPDLVMDADNKRLHIVGGSYDVRPEGIVD